MYARKAHSMPVYTHEHMHTLTCEPLSLGRLLHDRTHVHTQSTDAAYLHTYMQACTPASRSLHAASCATGGSSSWARVPRHQKQSLAEPVLTIVCVCMNVFLCTCMCISSSWAKDAAPSKNEATADVKTMCMKDRMHVSECICVYIYASSCVCLRMWACVCGANVCVHANSWWHDSNSWQTWKRPPNKWAEKLSKNSLGSRVVVRCVYVYIEARQKRLDRIPLHGLVQKQPEQMWHRLKIILFEASPASKRCMIFDALIVGDSVSSYFEKFACLLWNGNHLRMRKTKITFMKSSLQRRLNMPIKWALGKTLPSCCRMALTNCVCQESLLVQFISQSQCMRAKRIRRITRCDWEQAKRVNCLDDPDGCIHCDGLVSHRLHLHPPARNSQKIP